MIWCYIVWFVALKVAIVQCARNLFLVNMSIFISAPTSVATIASIFHFSF